MNWGHVNDLSDVQKINMRTKSIDEELKAQDELRKKGMREILVSQSNGEVAVDYKDDLKRVSRHVATPAHLAHTEFDDASWDSWQSLEER